MRKIIDWFADNSVVANLLMMIIIVGGLLSLPGIKKEIFPDISLRLIIVSVPYPGAAPEEVEESICVRVEEEIEEIEGIEKISSVAAENAGIVIVEVAPDADTRQVMEDIKSKVDAIDTFPEHAEDPVVVEILSKHQVINVAVSGDTDEFTLKNLGQRIRDEIVALPEITQAVLVNARSYEISIELAEEDMRRHSITFDDVVGAVKRSSRDMPGGIIKTEGGEILLRTLGQAYVGEDFANIVIFTRPDGTRLRVGDVAKVIDGFAEEDKMALFNGQPAVNVRIFRVGDQSVLDVADAVKRYVNEARQHMPEGITLSIWQDNSSFFKSRLELLRRNGIMGFILVFIILMLFLRFKLAFWVSLGIPISFLGAVWLMPVLGVSVNMLSLFSFILVLGIVVDDAIIVGENIYTHQRLNKTGLQASVDGTMEVNIPVVFAVLTTMTAFAPMLFLPGFMGDIWRIIPLIVIACLAFSLIECLLILPSHLSHFDPKKEELAYRGLTGHWKRFQEFFSNGLELFVRRCYRPAIQWALQRRYLVLAIAVAMLILTIGYLRGGYIRLILMPKVEADFVVASLTMAQGTPVEVTRKAINKIEQAALKIRDEFPVKYNGVDGSVILHVLSTVGEQPMGAQKRRHAGARVGVASEPHLGEIILELVPSENRNVSSELIARRWRELTGSIPDATELVFSASLMDTGAALNFQLAARDIDMLRQAGDELKAKLAEYSGVFDISDSYEGGKREIKFTIKPAAEALGISVADLGRQVRQAFYGDEAQRIQRGRDDIRVMVRYPYEHRRSPGYVEQMRIRTPQGLAVPISEVASVNYGRGYAAIRRTDRKRVLNVVADVDPTQGNAHQIRALLEKDYFPQLVKKYPGLDYTLEGEQRAMSDTMRELFRKFLLALLVMFVLMAVPFRSYLQPLIVMLAIPFGLVGAVLGHIIMGMDLSVLSMCGLVALSGVVVNDSLVMVHYINRKRQAGRLILEAVAESGAARFRPIILTSLTTFAGLTPLMLEKSMQARFMIPMAVSLAFGVIFATAITLFIIPSAYVILEDIKKAFRSLFGHEVLEAEK